MANRVSHHAPLTQQAPDSYDDDVAEFGDILDSWLELSPDASPLTPNNDAPCLRDSPLLGFYHNGYSDSEDEDDEPVDPTLTIGSGRSRANMRSCPNLHGLPHLNNFERRRDREEFRRQKALRQLLEEQEAQRRTEREAICPHEALVSALDSIPPSPSPSTLSFAARSQIAGGIPTPAQSASSVSLATPPQSPDMSSISFVTHLASALSSAQFSLKPSLPTPPHSPIMSINLSPTHSRRSSRAKSISRAASQEWRRALYVDPTTGAAGPSDLGPLPEVAQASIPRVPSNLSDHAPRTVPPLSPTLRRRPAPLEQPLRSKPATPTPSMIYLAPQPPSPTSSSSTACANSSPTLSSFVESEDSAGELPLPNVPFAPFTNWRRESASRWSLNSSRTSLVAPPPLPTKMSLPSLSRKKTPSPPPSTPSTPIKSMKSTPSFLTRSSRRSSKDQEATLTSPLVAPRARALSGARAALASARASMVPSSVSAVHLPPRAPSVLDDLLGDDPFASPLPCAYSARSPNSPAPQSFLPEAPAPAARRLKRSLAGLMPTLRRPSKSQPHSPVSERPPPLPTVASSPAMAMPASVPKAQRRYVLVLRGLPARGDAEPAVRAWVKNMQFGEVRRVARAPDGAVCVEFKKGTVDPTVLAIRGTFNIRGLGDADLVWRRASEAKAHPLAPFSGTFQAMVPGVAMHL